MATCVQAVIKQTGAFIEAVFYVTYGQSCSLVRHFKPCVLGGPQKHQVPAGHREVSCCRTRSASIQVSDITPTSFIQRGSLCRLVLNTVSELHRVLHCLLDSSLLVPWRGAKYFRQHQARDGVVVRCGVRRSASDEG